jgi:hypothetical protein
MRVLDDRRLLRWPPASPTPLVAGPPTSVGRWVLWRWLPWTTPTLRLAPRFRPRERFELVLCETFRCRPRLSAAALVERLAPAPAAGALDGAPPGMVAGGPLGRAGAWALVRRWVDEERLVLESR